MNSIMKNLLVLAIIASYGAQAGASCDEAYRNEIYATQAKKKDTDDCYTAGWVSTMTVVGFGILAGCSISTSVNNSKEDALQDVVNLLNQAKLGDGVNLRKVATDVQQPVQDAANKILKLNDLNVFCSSSSLASVSDIKDLLRK